MTTGLGLGLIVIGLDLGLGKYSWLRPRARPHIIWPRPRPHHMLASFTSLVISTNMRSAHVKGQKVHVVTKMFHPRIGKSNQCVPSWRLVICSAAATGQRYDVTPTDAHLSRSLVAFYASFISTIADGGQCTRNDATKRYRFLCRHQPPVAHNYCNRDTR